MASKGYIAQLLNRLPADDRQVLLQAFEHVLDEWRLGDSAKATNAAWYQLESTTASGANTEFSIRHGLGFTPVKLIPVLPLDTVNAQLIPLTVSRAADGQRIYLKSSSTSTVFRIYVE